MGKKDKLEENLEELKSTETPKEENVLMESEKGDLPTDLENGNLKSEGEPIKPEDKKQSYLDGILKKYKIKSITKKNIHLVAKQEIRKILETEYGKNNLALVNRENLEVMYLTLEK